MDRGRQEPWAATSSIARAILNSTRWELTAELGVGHHAKLRDRIWSEVALLDHFEERAVLADMAKGRLRRKIPDLARALEGHFDDHHARLAGSILHRLDLVDRALVELDQVITAQCQPWAHQIELLQTIPGVGERVAQVLVAETGADMSRFPSAAHLAAWAGLAPAMYESAGKRSPAGKRHGNKWLTAMLVEAAGSVGRMHGKNHLAAQHARLTQRRGRGRAQVAVAHSILVSAYHMLERDEPYRDLGADWLSRRNDEAHTRRLVAHLERLGHTVHIDPAVSGRMANPDFGSKKCSRS